MNKFSYLILLGVVKVGTTLTCFEDDQMKGGKLDTSKNCSTPNACFFNMASSAAGCLPKGMRLKCKPDKKCWFCTLNNLCNDQDFIDKKTAQRKDLDRINSQNGDAKNYSHVCYRCRNDDDCNKSLTDMEQCNSLSDCYYGFLNGKSFKGCHEAHCAKFHETEKMSCYNCSENLCNAQDESIECHQCYGRQCVIANAKNKIETCKSTKKIGCSSFIKKKHPRGRCGNACIQKDNLTKCRFCVENLCNAFTDAEAIEHFDELTATPCYKCDAETCRVNDVNMGRCDTSFRCFLSIVNYVEKRGCGLYCHKHTRMEEHRANGTIDYCFECKTTFCNTNQERQMFVNEDFETKAPKPKPIKQKSRITSSCRNTRARLLNISLVVAILIMLKIV